jgi:hypothetical protein
MSLRGPSKTVIVEPLQTPAQQPQRAAPAPREPAPLKPAPREPAPREPA